ncbi:hypothetical protein NMY22_g17678 [Coprinellus aureogranulatus]|nr:hypothetical protein NMY22_g17678 [Coprinellus aureogranulatus]
MPPPSAERSSPREFLDFSPIPLDIFPSNCSPQTSILPLSLRIPTAVRDGHTQTPPQKRQISSTETNCPHGHPDPPIRPSVLDSHRPLTVWLLGTRSPSHPVDDILLGSLFN